MSWRSGAGVCARLAIHSEPVAAIGNPPTQEANWNGCSQRPPERQNEISDQTQDCESDPEDLSFHASSLRLRQVRRPVTNGIRSFAAVQKFAIGQNSLSGRIRYRAEFAISEDSLPARTRCQADSAMRAACRVRADARTAGSRECRQGSAPGRSRSGSISFRHTRPSGRQFLLHFPDS